MHLSGWNLNQNICHFVVHTIYARTQKETHVRTHIQFELNWKRRGFFLAILNDSEWEKQRNLSEWNRNLLEWWAKAFRQKSDLNWNCVRVLFILQALWLIKQLSLITIEFELQSIFFRGKNIKWFANKRKFLNKNSCLSNH